MTDRMPEPETSDLGRYLEDTITIDWQSPVVMSKAKELLGDRTDPEERVRTIFEFVRDEIPHSLDIETEAQTCRASDVLTEGTGLCYAKSHLMAGLLRYAGYPAGFCYARLLDEERPGHFVLHAFNAVFWLASKSWIFLDARGDREGVSTEFRSEAPWSLAYWPDAEKGEAFLPFIYKRPGKRIIDLLERAPSFEAICRSLPDSL